MCVSMLYFAIYFDTLKIKVFGILFKINVDVYLISEVLVQPANSLMTTVL